MLAVHSCQPAQVGLQPTSKTQIWRAPPCTATGQKSLRLLPRTCAGRLTEADLVHLERAAQLSASSAGLTQPHPNAACVLVSSDGRVIAEAWQRAQGTEAPECQAVCLSEGSSQGSTAYLNLETGDCHGETAAVRALIDGGVGRVVVGLRHPLPHLRGSAIAALRQAGVQVEVLGEDQGAADPVALDNTYLRCLQANEALLHRAVTRRPLGVLKYAMTLDGKIATQTGHSAWVTSPAARARVFETRACSDAVIVGGQTVRRDNPQLTTRREGGHLPVRIVMSRTLDLPQCAKLWDVSTAPTLVMTQRRVKRDFQQLLRDKGVEVVEFDFLTPDAVAEYCYERGFLQLLWECGGMLAAPAIAGQTIHKLMAFVAPKVIGGPRAPTPVGELGFVEMTQALDVVDSEWQQVGPDLLLQGYLPASGGLRQLAAQAEALSKLPGFARAVAGVAVLANSHRDSSLQLPMLGSAEAVTAGALASSPGSAPGGKVIEFYKAWDRWGALSNFSPHAIVLDQGPVLCSDDAGADGSHGTLVRSEAGHEVTASGNDQQRPSPSAGPLHRPAPDSNALPSSSGRTNRQQGMVGVTAGKRRYPSVEHFYQSQKFAGVAAALELSEAIIAAPSPEEAARLGRRAERQQKELLRHDWTQVKVAVMRKALRAKFSQHEGPRQLLLASGTGDNRGSLLLEASPHDVFWGRGFNGTGKNMLGKLLMELREELLLGEQQRASLLSDSSALLGRDGVEGNGAIPLPVGLPST